MLNEKIFVLLITQPVNQSITLLMVKAETVNFVVASVLSTLVITYFYHIGNHMLAGTIDHRFGNY